MTQGMQGDISQFFGGSGFDPNSVAPAEDFDVLPAGEYPAMIEVSAMKETKKKNGHYLGLQFVIVDGPAKGRKLWDRLNIDNPDDACVGIALRALSALCKATIGDVPFTNESQLLRQTCMLHVKIDKSGENAIRTYSRFGDGQSVQVGAPPAPAPPAPPAPPVQPPAPLMQREAPAFGLTTRELQSAPMPPPPPAPQAPCGGQQVAQMQAAQQQPAPAPAPATQQPQVPWAGQ